uniref:Uncharacterized protein n=1 Tax=Arundo donax TaxID=35708 RepID=A0A0A9HPV5_ARUDO
MFIASRFGLGFSKGSFWLACCSEKWLKSQHLDNLVWEFGLYGVDWFAEFKMRAKIYQTSLIKF